MNKKHEAVFFDFDGVILDSVEVKTKAFGMMFAQYGKEIEEEVMAYHLNNGGISRYEKFRHYYENLLKKPINQEIMNTLSREFSAIAFEQVLKSPFIPGASETLKELQRLEVPCYVISGTPDTEIKEIVKQKGLSQYFAGVFGSPRKKWAIAEEIVKQKGYSPSKCLFIGDAMSDYNCAEKLNMDFLGIVKPNEKIIFPEGTTVSEEVNIKQFSKIKQN